MNSYWTLAQLMGRQNRLSVAIWAAAHRLRNFRRCSVDTTMGFSRNLAWRMRLGPGDLDIFAVYI